MKYKVYIISEDGDGKVQSLHDWDGEENLELHLNAFARDAVISIEPSQAGQDEGAK